MSRRLRFGTVPYLNALPLVGPLEEDPPQPVELVRDVPSQLARRLLRGEVDAALVSSIACLRHPELALVPGIAIACRGPVESIKLLSKVPLAEIRTLALDRSSLTSVVLVQILLRERYRICPETVVLPPHLPTMLSCADAALLIGDPGLASSCNALEIEVRFQLDPGQEWFEWTGLPFVFAAWVYRRERGCEGWARVLVWAKEQGLRQLSRWARRAAESTGLPLQLCESYLRHNVRYDLGEPEMEALARFRELAVRHGFLPR